MKEPSVTIILTVRNMSNTIEKCVESLLNLNYKNKKIFVTDAFSTDGTFEKLEKYGNKIRLERIKGNMSKAYNYMIKNINTEFAAFTDADCVVDKNWLKILVSSFESGVVAVGGTVNTPKDANELQIILGKELEGRYKRFPKSVQRLPTMNLCVRTNAAKKIKFNEYLDVVQETDWNYKLGKFGKIVFNPKAKLMHYHRSTLKGYIKQQFRYGTFVPQVYLTNEHFNKIKGDNISTSIMPLQLTLIMLIILSSSLTIAFNQLFPLTLILLVLLFFSYIFDSLRITKIPSEILLLIPLFLLRNLIWFGGIFYGIFKMLFLNKK
jgi:glycosyltransferase involved in cell wall biosynthesis